MAVAWLLGARRRARARVYAWGLAALTCASWGATRMAQGAQSLDPRLHYRTLHGAYFAVHYPPGAFGLALRVLRTAQDVRIRDGALFGYAPVHATDIVLSDSQDLANGWAQTIPKNTLRLFLAAPTEQASLAAYDDWLRMLLTHELAHICDIDHTVGAAAGLKKLFGSTIMPNGYVPQFWSEGVAVFAETKLTAYGRGRAAYAEMVLRMAALSGRFLHLDQANVLLGDYPFGDAAYFYGGRFHLYLAQRLGTASVVALHRTFAGQAIPYLMGTAARTVYGTDLLRLWQDFAADELAVARSVRAFVEAQGATASLRLTHHGRFVTGARFSPDGAYIAYSRQSPKDGVTLRLMRADGRDDRRLALDVASSHVAFSPDGRCLYYTQAAQNHRYDAYHDIYRYDLVAGRARRLVDAAHPHRSLRARDVAVSPDGRRLAFVQNRLAASYLAVADIDADHDTVLHVRVLGPPRQDVQVAGPAFSPDGKVLALIVTFATGQRDLVCLDASTGRLLHRITSDKSVEDSPTFSPDGRYLLYDADLDGIINLYAYDLKAHRIYRITHVVGGAASPEIDPEGHTLLFRELGADGWDLHTMPFLPETWAPQCPTREAGDPPVPAASADQQVEGITADAESVPVATGVDAGALAVATYLAAGERDTPYSPWRTLLPLHNNWNLSPAFFLLNGDPYLSLRTFGQDALQVHSYQLALGASYFGHHANVSFDYAYDGFDPTLTLSLSDAASTYQSQAGRAVLVARQVTYGTLWPLNRRQGVFLGYNYAHLSGNALAPVVSRLGNFGSLQLGYRYSRVRRFAHSVGGEYGRAFAASLTGYARSLGSDYTQLLASLDGRAYLNNPLWYNHVLALRLVLNRAFGPDVIANYFLYGTQGVSVLTVQTTQLFGLRGFYPGTGPFGAPSPGSGLMAGYAEYRFPLWHIQRGVGTWPVTLQRLHAAFFADAGTTFDRVVTARGTVTLSPLQGLARTWLSCGAEIRLDAVFGWVQGLTLRGGVAVPAVVAGHAAPWLALVPYVDVGTAL